MIDAVTPLGFRVQVSLAMWQVISEIKHRGLRDREAEVERTLSNPDEIRRSSYNARVFLFYRKAGPLRYVCAVAKRETAEDGDLITAYDAEAMKAGERIWPT